MRHWRDSPPRAPGVRGARDVATPACRRRSMPALPPPTPQPHRPRAIRVACDVASSGARRLRWQPPHSRSAHRTRTHAKRRRRNRTRTHCTPERALAEGWTTPACPTAGSSPLRALRHPLDTVFHHWWRCSHSRALSFPQPLYRCILGCLLNNTTVNFILTQNLRCNV